MVANEINALVVAERPTPISILPRHPVGILAAMYLFAAFLGGPVAAGRMGEDHEVVLVVASDAEEARDRAKSKWSGVGRGHVDAVQRVDCIDGYEVALVPMPHARGDQAEMLSDS